MASDEYQCGCEGGRGDQFAVINQKLLCPIYISIKFYQFDFYLTPILNMDCTLEEKVMTIRLARVGIDHHLVNVCASHNCDQILARLSSVL